MLAKMYKFGKEVKFMYAMNMQQILCKGIFAEVHGKLTSKAD